MIVIRTRLTLVSYKTCNNRSTTPSIVHTEFELLNYTMHNVSERVHGFDNVYEDEYRVEIRMQIGRRSSYYALAFVLPSAAITALSLFGSTPFVVHTHTFAGMFIPSMNTQERTEKCTMGLTALLTMSIVLLMVTDVMPKVDAGRFPLLGGYAAKNHSSTIIAGIFILCEIALSTIGTLIAIVIMYLHSNACYGQPVPDWLYKLVRLSNTASADPLMAKTALLYDKVLIVGDAMHTDPKVVPVLTGV